ncbi:MAG: formate dehydrogenase accessory sulfurtransferase FdhD [Deltaproteobacteria bacterium]|nr:formate dehydrogenase accessory sulfurtransferase FdhD [Deltaproteobacteria bacterium]
MDRNSFFNYRDGKLEPVQGKVVREFPLQLIVNGREIATLIASPHDLRFLVAGFLLLQGFVRRLADFEMFSVCEDFGTANVRIKGDLPERLKPVLTSGCGTGISFSMPDALHPPLQGEGRGGGGVNPADIFALMEQLAGRADNYRTHGGIHSAAVGRGGELLLYAEDLGRHNTLDRIAGEALFKGIDLVGTTLVTSGRVSTEMVAKAALLGVRLIASRTSPTDMAVRLCDQSGISLVGYVRGGRFTAYSHAEALEQYPDSARIEGVTGVILAGGASRRMGSNKALLTVDDTPLIEGVYRTLAPLFRDVVIVTNTPEEYSFIPCRTVPDIFPGAGSIAGLHSGLVNSSTERIFVVACDMPSLSAELVRRLCAVEGEWDAVVPLNDAGYLEPLHAVYSRSCLNEIQKALENDDKSILLLFDRIRTRKVGWEEIKGIEGALESFRNVNTPEEYGRIREAQPGAENSSPCAGEAS